MFLEPDRRNDTASRPGNRLSIVIPCYNEQEVLPHLLTALTRICTEAVSSRRISEPVEVLLVDDGSSDGTWAAIHDASADTSGPLRVHGVKLSRNHGHQRALLAGLMMAGGDIVISMDADLQDDPDAALDMIDAWRNGAEIVYGQRADRTEDNLLKRGTARGFYRLMRWFGADLVPDHADYRLMSRKALEMLRDFPEENLFLRGIVPQIGLPSAIVRYHRPARVAGESKYPLSRMLGLALDGITSFSTRPLRMITAMGATVSGFALLYLVYSVFRWVVGETVPGWTSMIVVIAFLGGAQLLALGIIGEYIGKMYLETKRRPRFLIETRCEPPQLRSADRDIAPEIVQDAATCD